MGVRGWVDWAKVEAQQAERTLRANRVRCAGCNTPRREGERWFKWCPPCKQLRAVLTKLSRKHTKLCVRCGLLMEKVNGNRRYCATCRIERKREVERESQRRTRQRAKVQA